MTNELLKNLIPTILKLILSIIINYEKLNSH